MGSWRRGIGILVSVCSLVVSASMGAASAESAAMERGKYLVVIGGCHDCHTPKVETDKGPVLDTKNLLAGFLSTRALPAVPAGIIGPKSWGGLFSNDLTGWAGPWGTSFASNLTPDRETGIGAWKEATFLEVIRSGKTPGGRPILPPMPWENLRQASEKDLKAIFAYLVSIRPVRNMVPAPVPPKK